MESAAGSCPGSAVPQPDAREQHENLVCGTLSPANPSQPLWDSHTFTLAGPPHPLLVPGMTSLSLHCAGALPNRRHQAALWTLGRDRVPESQLHFREKLLLQRWRGRGGGGGGGALQSPFGHCLRQLRGGGWRVELSGDPLSSVCLGADCGSGALQHTPDTSGNSDPHLQDEDPRVPLTATSRLSTPGHSQTLTSIMSIPGTS